MSLDPDTTLGVVRLAVADVDRALGFYRRALGLRLLDGEEDALRLGAGGRAIVELVPSPEAPPSEPGTTGLFHLAILVPSRPELGRAARRILRAGWPLSGAADHLVSEALYLEDPEGNGIEISRDRPRAEWSYEDGAVQMATLPLDLDGLLAAVDAEPDADIEAADGGPEADIEAADGEPDAESEVADREPDAEIAAGTRIGHVHLKVGELSSVEGFYADVLGFDVSVRGYRGALFLSAGGYHHQIGLNTWTSRGGVAPPADARGLRWFEIVLAGSAELEQAAARVDEHGIEAHSQGDRLRLTDPSGNGVVLRARAE